MGSACHETEREGGAALIEGGANRFPLVGYLGLKQEFQNLEGELCPWLSSFSSRSSQLAPGFPSVLSGLFQ